MASGKEGERDHGGDGPWSDVKYRKNRKRKGDGVEWSFLVQNLCDRTTRNVLWQAFKPYDSFQTYTSPAREMLKETLTVMNTIKIFDVKVIVSHAKYDKDHKWINYGPDIFGRSVWRPKEIAQNDKNYHDSNDNGGQQPGGKSYVRNQAPGQAASGSMFVHEGTSFADLVRDKGGENGNGAKVVTVNGKGSLYPLHFIGRSVLGYAKRVMSLRKVKLAIDGEGMSKVGLSYVGGMIFILTFKDNVTASACMELHSTFFDSFFSKYYLWNGDEVLSSRLQIIQ
ncbi:hypothetical protein Hanom_Chr04g00340781 [Helianthus anomalus]